jgi:integrase
LATWKNIEKEGVKQYFDYDRAKTGQNARVYLIEQASQQLPQRIKATAPLFANLPTGAGANKVLKGWMQEAGIEKHITFYCARHTFGTLQALQNTNSIVISRTMGQASTAHTMKYINHVSEAQDESVMGLGW